MSRTMSKSWILVLVAVSLVQNAVAQCTRPANPRNGEIRFRSANPRNTFRGGTLLRFVCNDAAFMTVPASGMIECVGDRWEPNMQCVPRNCPSLPELLRGEISYRSGSTGVTARYACTVPGYRLNGERRRTCQEDGTWTDNSPTCRAMAICPELEEQDHIIRRRMNGRRREGLWIYGSRHHFSCEEGYVLNSSSVSGGFYPTIQCTRNGWNASVPTCIDNPRCPPILDEIENGRSTAQNRTYAAKEIIEFICNEGYRTTSQSWRACAMTNTINGYISEWHGVTPSCEEITCPSLRGYIENGAAIGTSHRIGANVTFRCDSGYELIGKSRLTCSRLGRWNGTLPVCDTGENDCPVLGIPINGHKVGDRYNKYDQVDFSCERGYTLIGSSFRRCRSEGLWDGEPVKCMGSHDFDDVNELSVKFRGSLDILQADALYEAEVSNDSTNSVIDNRGRLIPLTHNVGLELYFIFDGSSSIGEVNFNSSKKFAKELVKEIGVTDRPNSLRVGAMVFGSEADVVFHTVDFETTDEVIAGINSIPYKSGGTNIAKAFDRLLNVMIPQSRALNRPGSFKTVFLITDGEPTEGGDSRDHAQAVRDADVTIHCIGVSEGASRKALRDLASEPLGEHLFFLKKYSTLETLIKLVTNQSLDYSEPGINSPQALAAESNNNGDTPAQAGSWPWQVLFTIMKEPNKEFVCGGTLIKADWILTAAHCFQGISSYKAYAGIIDKHNLRDELRLKTPPNVIIHPAYDNATKRNDIALIQLIQPAKLSVNVRTACLPDPAREDKLLYRGSAVMTGWGHNGVVENGAVGDNPVQHLQQLTLPLHRRADCEASLEGQKEENWFDDGMTCAGYLNRQVGACQGDSGGPLVKYAKVGDERRWVIIGINSWGIGCALEDELDFFTNVPHFVDWINEKITPPDAEDAVEPDEPAEPAQ